jgi:uncharacterized membrane protein
MAPQPRTPRRGPWALRIVRARPRLFWSAAVGVALAAVLTLTGWQPVTRILVGWDVGVVLYLALVAHMMWRSDVARIRDRATVEDEGRLAILVLTALAGLASLGAIFAVLPNPAGGGRSGLRVVHAALTILLSWAFVHTIFALHYAHEFYDVTAGGLAFPTGAGDPDYWDFVYFSFVIGMTSQVSDVAVTSKEVRRIVTAHGVLSFVFNAALLALTVNLAAGAL